MMGPMIELNAYARERLKELQSSRAHPAVTGHFQRMLAEGDDLQVFKINAFRVAQEVPVPRPEALRGFLFATKLGLFDLSYDVHCPSCRGIPEYHGSLEKLSATSRCCGCDVGFEVDFESHVEVTFTVNPAVRPVTYADFARRDLPAQMKLQQSLRSCACRSFPVPELPVTERASTVNGAVTPGDYLVYLTAGEGAMARGCKLTVSGAPAETTQRLELTFDEKAAATPARAELRPGQIALQVAGRQPRPAVLIFRPLREETNWVSAAHVTSQQDFRDLFSGEFLGPGVNFAVRSVTLMFTDLKGSTELYEALGDAKAYSLVQEHFQILTSAIRRHEGGIVKTIGDAVMASFPDNLSAVKAAVEIQRALATAGGEVRKLQVKIGLHQGPTIAVTSNRALDFFGRTVNVAARVQNESRAGEVVLSNGVMADPRVPAFLAEQRLPPAGRQVHLKGISGTMDISCLRP